MTFGINPFSKQDHDFPGVIVPLSNAPAHSHPQTSPDPEKKVGPDDKTDTGSLDRAPSAENGVGSIHSHQPSHDGHLTLEILRAEVENDVVASGHDSAYDRTLNFLFYGRGLFFFFLFLCFLKNPILWSPRYRV